MVFLSICPRDKKYLDYSIGDIPLKVVLDDGAEFAPDVDVQVTDLNKGYKHFKIDSGKGNEFSVTVMIHKSDKVHGHDHVVVKNIDTSNIPSNLAGNSLIDDDGRLVKDYYKDFTVSGLLNYFYRHGTPLYIRCSDVKINADALWLITKNKSRKYERGGFQYWDLTFTQYVAVKYATFTNTNSGVQAALKKQKSSKSKKASQTKEQKALSKCKPTVLKYSKKKKVVACVKTLQKVLYKNGSLKGNKKTVIDGWFGKGTLEAVKIYQNKYKKKYGLNPTGEINTRTYAALCGTPLPAAKKTSKKKSGQIGKTITIKSDTKGILK